MDIVPQDNQIRLVAFLETDDIHLSRKRLLDLPTEHTLTKGFPYIALSYSWGEHRASIKCDVEILEVSSNLVPALHQIRYKYPGWSIRTDSISINQHHAHEKAHQVSMMGRIFRSAEFVIVWLGDDTEDIFDGLGRWTSPPQTKTIDDDEEVSNARVKLIRRISQIQWFYRAWTFQEIRLARKAVVLMGTKSMPWTDFINKIQHLRTLEPKLSTVELRSQIHTDSRFNYIVQDRFFAILDELNSGTSSDLAGLLFVTWYRDASERRDKVYSLLSTALVENFSHGIKIDYDVPWSILCIKTARACINTGSKLKILKIAGMTRRWRSAVTSKWDSEEMKYLLDHPSWVPNWWTPPQQTRSHPSLMFDERGCFNQLSFCCLDEPPEQSVEDVSPFLTLRGVVLGILNVGDHPTYPGGATLVHAPPHCTQVHTRRWLKVPESCGSPPNSLQGVSQVYMPSFAESVLSHLHGKCPCVPSGQGTGFDPFNTKFPAYGPHRFEKLELQFGNIFFALYHVAFDTEIPEASTPAQVLAASVESGDWLVLLEGGGTPFVLRPAVDKFGRVRLPRELMTADERESLSIADDAGCFVLVGEASLCWDRLWPGDWDTYCRAGTFVIV